MKRPFTLCAHFRVKGRRSQPGCWVKKQITLHYEWDIPRNGSACVFCSRFCAESKCSFQSESAALACIPARTRRQAHQLQRTRHGAPKEEEEVKVCEGGGTALEAGSSTRAGRGGQLPGPCRTAAHLAHSHHKLRRPPNTRTRPHTPPGTPGLEKRQNNGRERREKKGGRGRNVKYSTLRRGAEKRCSSGAGEKKSCLQKSQTFSTLPHSSAERYLHQYKHNNGGKHLTSDTSQTDICVYEYVYVQTVMLYVLQAKYRQTGSKDGKAKYVRKATIMQRLGTRGKRLAPSVQVTYTQAQNLQGSLFTHDLNLLMFAQQKISALSPNHCFFPVGEIQSWPNYNMNYFYM